MLAGCVTGPVDITPAKAIFPGMSQGAVREKAIARCVDRGFTVEQSSENLVVCSKLADKPKERFAALAAMGFPNTYGPIYVKIQCTVFSADGTTRATLHQWIETENVFGKALKTQLGGDSNREMLHNALIEMGGQ